MKPLRGVLMVRTLMEVDKLQVGIKEDEIKTAIVN